MIAYLEFVFVRLLIKFIQLLPFDVLMGLAKCIGDLGWWLDPIHRRVILKNLEIALGDSRGNRMEDALIRLGRESFVRFVENTFAAAWIAGRADYEIRKMIEVTGVQEHLLPAKTQNRGVIHVMFHLGNWEALARIVAQIPGIQFSTIYQPLKNPYLNRMIAHWRKRSGVELINRHHGFVDVIRRLRRGEAVGMLVDQHAGDHGMWLPFFGRLASTTTLPAILARRTGATIIPIFCLSNFKGQGTPSTRWRFEFGPPIHSTKRSDGEIMMDIHRRLEEVIRRDPANWFWVHHRWKTPSPNFLLKKYPRGIYVPHDTRLKPFRILVRSVNWLGDAVLTIPAIRAIRAGRPDCHLTILTSPKLAEFWKEQSYVDEVAVSVDELQKHPEFDAAVLFPNSLRSVLEVLRLGIPKRMGYAGHWRRVFLTSVCPEAQKAGLFEHDVKDFCGLVRWLGGEIESEVPSWEINDPEINSRNYVVLHPGAAHGSAKRWLPERFVELVKLFPDIHWRLIGTADECDRNAHLSAQMGNHVEDWTGKFGMARLAKILSGARVVVCNDSGPMHLAAAVGAPVLAIFGSTEPLHTGPIGRPGRAIRVIRHFVECSPCYRKECPIDLRCMKATSVEEVAEALRELLSSR